MSPSPIEELTAAIDKLDLDAAVALMAPDVRFVSVDGRHGEGTEAVRALLADFTGSLRSSAHRITDEWHEDNVWIAEVDAKYELKDGTRLGSLLRAFVVRGGPSGLSSVRIYGAQEQRLPTHRSGEQGMRLGGHWIPPL